ncbi:MAG: hypothetical protein IIW08_00505 [Clostridia bacterium]|nr:hypothetical protein [Clostridia bacterium]MBQ5769634.1 hypothetical protein [Clostridia bacterium]
MIENRAVDCFYAGSQGAFDAMAGSLFRELRSLYPSVRFYIVLDRMPDREDPTLSSEHTLLPEGIETVPPRFALVKRNEWMLKKSDYVISYVIRSFGGAAKFQAMAIRKGKTVVSLS